MYCWWNQADSVREFFSTRCQLLFLFEYVLQKFCRCGVYRNGTLFFEAQNVTYPSIEISTNFLEFWGRLRSMMHWLVIKVRQGLATVLPTIKAQSGSSRRLLEFVEVIFPFALKHAPEQRFRRRKSYFKIFPKFPPSFEKYNCWRNCGKPIEGKSVFHQSVGV